MSYELMSGLGDPLMDCMMQSGMTWDDATQKCVPQSPAEAACLKAGGSWGSTNGQPPVCIPAGTSPQQSCALTGGTWDAAHNACQIPLDPATKASLDKAAGAVGTAVLVTMAVGALLIAGAGYGIYRLVESR